MKTGFKFTFVLSELLLSTATGPLRPYAGWAAERKVPLQSSSSQGKKGPHGGQIVSDRGKKFEIKLDQETQQLDVYTSNTEKTPPPKELGVTLYKDDKTGRTIRLKTVESNPPGPDQQHYHGDIDASEAPYVALGLQFDLSPNPEPHTQTDDK